MNKYINVSTHHAYLNTDIVLSSTLPFVELQDVETGIKYLIENQPLILKFCAGYHRLYCESLNEDVEFTIEDAIKLGGSNLTRAFVFDENPWVFVVAKDRLYAANLETKEEMVEYNLTPDEISAFSSYQGETCDFFLFKTKQDYSIYEVTTGCNIISFTDYIFCNSHLVVYKEEGSIIVYNFRLKKSLIEFSGEYSIGSKQLYYIKDGKVNVFDLESDLSNVVDCIDKVSRNCILVDDYFLQLHEDGRTLKRYLLYFLGSNNPNMSKVEIITPMYIESLKRIKSTEYCHQVDTFTSFLKQRDDLTHSNFGFEFCCSGIKIEDVRTFEDEKKIILFGQIVSYPPKPYKIPFSLKGKFGEKINFRNIQIETYNPEEINSSNSLNSKIVVDNDTRLLGVSKSQNLYVSISNGEVFFHNRLEDKHILLFKNSLDTSFYNSAYFTSDGKNVVFIGKDKSMGIMDFDNMLQQPFEVEGSTVARHAGFNGYNPEIFIQEGNGRLPVWRDPISLQKITEEDMSNHIFKSPDGRYVAFMQKETVYYNHITNLEIGAKDYYSLKNTYNWDSISSEDEIHKKVLLRKQLIEKYGKDRVFKNLHEYNERTLGSSSLEKLIARNNEDEEKYIKSQADFISLFVDILGYVCYQENESGRIHRILIGRSVWYLNYVSFSKDSHYLAFGAKMKEDDWRMSEEGVFELYDLREKKVVVRKDSAFDLQAVWMTMFSKNGDVAYYDSHANAMITYAESNYEYTSTARGKSLLCFSPTGRYIALSDQNYVSFKHNLGSKCGHQPSGNVFIYESEDMDKCLEHYNDFGDGIDGTTKITRHAGNVASAAFSADEQRLLAVGEDGVIVIRNLVAPKVEAEESNFIIHSGSVEKHYFRKKERHGIVTMTWCSGDGLRTDLVDFWCNPDETLDAEQGLVYSEDGSVLKLSLNIELKECRIPLGVKKIAEHVFHGVYSYEAIDNSLTDLYLPDSIECIEESFNDCPALKRIHVSMSSEDRIKSLLPNYIDKIVSN